MTPNQLPQWAIEAAEERFPQVWLPIGDGSGLNRDVNLGRRMTLLEGIRLALDRVRETEKGDQGHCPRGCDCFFQQGRESVRREVLGE